MLRKLGIPVLALAAALTAVVPTVSMARDRDDHHENFRGRDDRHERGDRDRDRDDRWRSGVGVYSAPAPVAVPAPAPAGYYDQYGVWHPYAYTPYGY